MYYQIIFYADVHFVLMIYKFRFSIFDSVFIVLVFCLCYLGSVFVIHTFNHTTRSGLKISV